MEIPYSELSEQALRGVIEEFVMREGTEYGPSDVSLETKVTQVLRQLERGDVVIVWDPALESCSILTKHQARKMREAEKPSE